MADFKLKVIEKVTKVGNWRTARFFFFFHQCETKTNFKNVTNIKELIMLENLTGQN